MATRYWLYNKENGEQLNMHFVKENMAAKVVELLEQETGNEYEYRDPVAKKRREHEQNEKSLAEQIHEQRQLENLRNGKPRNAHLQTRNP